MSDKQRNKNDQKKSSQKLTKQAYMLNLMKIPSSHNKKIQGIENMDTKDLEWQKSQ